MTDTIEVTCFAPMRRANCNTSRNNHATRFIVAMPALTLPSMGGMTNRGITKLDDYSLAWSGLVIQRYNAQGVAGITCPKEFVLQNSDHCCHEGQQAAKESYLTDANEAATASLPHGDIKTGIGLGS